jgi:hypothetical protein
MRKFITKISILALVGAMSITSMVGCGKAEEENSSASVTTKNNETEAVTTVEQTESEEDTTEITAVEEAVEETSEEVIETTEDPAIEEWKNGDYWYAGVSDLRENYDNIYATHFLIGDAIKLYENGTYDSIADGYDLMWKIYDENHAYYLRDFANITSCKEGLGGISASTLEDTPEEAGGSYYIMLYHNLENTALSLSNTTKYDIYDPFENGEAEYKDNTICILWQKEEGTLEGSQAFYYSIPSENYDAVMKILNNRAEEYGEADDSKYSVAYMFNLSGDTNTDSLETTEDTETTD